MSVTVTVCKPAVSIVAVAAVSALSQANVYGAVPPAGTTVAIPLASPLHTTGASSPAIQVNATGSVIVTSQVVVQPFISVTVTTCKPAVSIVAVTVVSALSQANVYGAVPPAGTTVAIPLASPLHTTGVSSPAIQVNATGSVIVTSQVVVQPFMSVTVTVCKPAVSIVAVAAVSALSQANV